MAVVLTNLSDVSIGATTAWTDMDLSGTIPATGILAAILVTNPSATPYEFGLRCNGSTDDRHTDIAAGTQIMFYVPLDGARICEGYIEHTDVNFYLAGYFTLAGGTAGDVIQVWTNGQELSVGSLNTWVNVDSDVYLSAYAQAAVVEIINTVGASPLYGVRPDGSTDNRCNHPYSHGCELIGVVSKVFECNTNSADNEFYLLAELGLFDQNINATDKSLGSTGAYAEIDLTSDGPIRAVQGAVFEIHSAFSRTALREKGSTDDYYLYTAKCAYLVGMDADDIVEGKIASTGDDWFVRGYVASPSADVAVADTFTFTEAVEAAQRIDVAIAETITFAEVVDIPERQQYITETITFTDVVEARKSFLTIEVDSRMTSIVTFDSKIS